MGSVAQVVPRVVLERTEELMVAGGMVAYGAEATAADCLVVVAGSAAAAKPPREVYLALRESEDMRRAPQVPAHQRGKRQIYTMGARKSGVNML